MKRLHRLALVLAAVFAGYTTASGAEPDATNNVSFSLRLGLNVSARFTGGTGLPTPASSRLTPNGATYNYDDGYVLADSSGNAGGQTWYWGYDNSMAQISGNTILLNRTAPAANLNSPWFDCDPNLGAEMTYSRRLGHLRDGKWHWGFEAAVNYTHLDLRDTGSYTGPGTRTTDAYPFTVGTTPPATTPSTPYQGTFSGPGFVIGSMPVSTSSSAIPDAVSVSGRREFDSPTWGFRFGPFLELPLTDDLRATISGGLALALIDAEASWNETFTFSGSGSVTGSGSVRDHTVMWGGYAAANLIWQMGEKWNLTGGVQYQSVGTYRHAVGARQVEVDLGNSIFVTLGLGCSF